MIEAIIAEDIKTERLHIEKILKENFADISLIASCSTYNETANALAKYKPQLLLFDIELDAGKLSFDLLKDYKNSNSEVVFITAYDQYALQAIQLSCCDYVLKPYSNESLVKAIEKAKKRIGEKDDLNRIELLLQNFRTKEPSQKIIALQNAAHPQKHEVIPVKNIMYVASQKDHTSLVVAQSNTPDKKIFKSVLSKGIGEMFEMLDDAEHFMRVHNQYIINASFITAFHKQDCLLTMFDGNEIPVSRENRHAVLRLLNLK